MRADDSEDILAAGGLAVMNDLCLQVVVRRDRLCVAVKAGRQSDLPKGSVTLATSSTGAAHHLGRHCCICQHIHSTKHCTSINSV